MSFRDYDLVLSVTDSTLNDVIDVIQLDISKKYDYFMQLNFDEVCIIKDIRELLKDKHDISLNFGYRKTNN